MSDNVKTLNGITFSTTEEYLRAKKELDGIRYVKENNDMSNDQTVLALYNKFVQKNVFRTQIGYEFLKELQERLMRSDSIDKSQVAKLPIRDYNDDGAKKAEEKAEDKPVTRAPARNVAYIETNRESSAQATSKKKPIMFLEAERTEKSNAELDVFKSKYRWSLFWNFLLAVVIVVMVYITLNGKHVNIINYESKLLDKYASWAQELSQKEEELNRLENELKSTRPD